MSSGVRDDIRVGDLIFQERGGVLNHWAVEEDDRPRVQADGKPVQQRSQEDLFNCLRYGKLFRVMTINGRHATAHRARRQKEKWLYDSEDRLVVETKCRERTTDRSEAPITGMPNLLRR